MEQMENGTVTISLEFFADLMMCKAQKNTLINITQSEKFSVSRELISDVLDFELIEHKEGKEE